MGCAFARPTGTSLLRVTNHLIIYTVHGNNRKWDNRLNKGNRSMGRIEQVEEKKRVGRGRERREGDRERKGIY